MKKFEIVTYGSCTAFVSRTIVVEAEDEASAREMVGDSGLYLSVTTDIDIDDDYSQLDSIKEI